MLKVNQERQLMVNSHMVKKGFHCYSMKLWSRIHHMVPSHIPFTVQTYQVQALGSLWYEGYCNLCRESPVILFVAILIMCYSFHLV
jgi:hypothetical protein